MKKPEFVFATCRAGSEPSLKREVAARHGGWLTPAFMRPQLITFKAKTEMRPDFELDAAFSSVSGFSAGMAKTAAEVAARVEEQGLEISQIHVFPRVIAEDGISEEVWQRVDATNSEIASLVRLTKTSALILDVILGEVGEPWFLGIHRRTPAAHPSPGALPRIQLPPEAPSRAWLKIEQSLAWLGLDAPGKLTGKTALELGSAPGGASWALLQRGMKVIGVDTGAMDERVLAHPNYHHISVPAGDVFLRDLPLEIDLLASDMNLHPGLVVKYMERFTRELNPRWLALTLKMNDAQVESQIPSLLQQLRRFTPGEVHARQLPANRREITVVSL
ncbi:MAG: SAM-dependent methyltransferase [Verrucomicrobiota bacterium]